MNSTPPARHERLLELFAAEACGELTPADAVEIQELLSEVSPAEAAALRRMVGSTELAMTMPRPSPTEPLPAGIRGKLMAQAESFFAGPAAMSPAPAVVARVGWASRMAWVAAAAGIALAGAAWWPTLTARSKASVDVVSVDRATDVVRIAFAPQVSGYTSAAGEVVWSDREQRGYMRLKNVPVNDAAKRQYQLWIIDPARDKRPVDGGVFNVSSLGEVVVPIDAKLRVDRPAGFAITAEKPGGVVVSDGPLLLVALRS